MSHITPSKFSWLVFSLQLSAYASALRFTNLGAGRRESCDRTVSRSWVRVIQVTAISRTTDDAVIWNIVSNIHHADRVVAVLAFSLLCIGDLCSWVLRR